MSKVSVIVPVFNSEKYLRACVESIIGQTFRDIEILFVDDGSSDASVSILKDYAVRDARIRVLQANHGGGGMARNRGIEEATGEYLSFFDSDDVMEPELIEHAYRKAVQTGADVVIFGARFWQERTGELQEQSWGLRMEMLPEQEVFTFRDMPGYIFNAFHNWPWNKMFRREWVLRQDIRFQPLMRTNDLLFTNKALILADRITVLNEKLVRYRVRVSGSCQSSNGEAPLDFYKAFLALREFLIGQGVYEQVKQSYVNHALDGCIANLNTADFSKGQKALYNLLKTEIFRALDIEGQPDSYFYPVNYENPNMERYHQILCGDYEEYLRFRANDLNRLYEEQLDKTYQTRQEFLSSASYRAGKLVTAPLRRIKRMIKG